jgi:hypothetical protein
VTDRAAIEEPIRALLDYVFAENAPGMYGEDAELREKAQVVSSALAALKRVESARDERVELLEENVKVLVQQDIRLRAQVEAARALVEKWDGQAAEPLEDVHARTTFNYAARALEAALGGEQPHG